MSQVNQMSVAVATPQPKTFRLTSTIAAIILPASTILILLVAWELAVLWTEVPRYILPTPTAIAARIIDDFATGEIQPNLIVTSAEVVAGLLIATACGVALGTAIGVSPLVEKAFYPALLVIQTIPKVAIAPLIIIWFGYGMSSKIASAALLGFFPIMVNVIAGIKAVDVRRVDLMRMMCASRWQIYLKVRLPNMLSYLFAGLEIAVVFCVIGAIVGEFVGASVGLGSMIIQRQSQVDVSGVFSVIAYLSGTALLLTVLVQYARRRIVFWA